MKIAEFFQGNNGKYSNMRLIAIMFAAASISMFVFCCIRGNMTNNEFYAITTLATIGAGAKWLQQKNEGGTNADK